MSTTERVNILIVDDLPDKLLALETILETLGQRVVLAKSGREALRLLLDQEFAVILLDVYMPEMDGFETASLIRRHKRCATTPIIFVTADADEMLSARGYSLGAVDYILSPVVPDVLRTKVSVFVDLFKNSEQVKRVAEERIALAQEQAARAAAEEANRRKDKFLAVLSHELRNPLAPIRNALHIFCTSHLDDPDLLAARDVLERQVQQLGRIVDDLLDVFRITQNKILLRREPLDLGRLASQAVEDHRQGIEGEHRVVSIELPGEPVWVSADRTRIYQVLGNLLHNATKFTGAGDRVSVCVSVDAQAKRAVVAVRDTGVGIAPETLPMIFDTFAQADQGIDRRRGGLGLGLALVKGLVELHGGDVFAHSDGIGRGAEVRFRIPLGVAPRPVAPPPAPAIQPANRLRILIVEDNRDMAMTLRTLLTRSGHDVSLAHSGVAGVEAARQGKPDVILCDLGLPEMDGYEVATTIRGIPETASTRLIAVSGYGHEEDRRRSEAAGFDLHLTKPVDPLELQRLLASFRRRL